MSDAIWTTVSFRRQLQAIQSLCLGMVAVMAFIALGFTSVVWLALDGQALAGQLYTIQGISILTVITGVLTPFVPLLAWWLSHQQSRQKLLGIAQGHPELADTVTDSGRLAELFAYKTYIDYAIPTGVAFAWAIVYHIVSDSWILVWIAFLLLYLLLRYPSEQRFVGWLNQAMTELQRLRASASA